MLPRHPMLFPLNDFIYIIEQETEMGKVDGFYTGEDGLPIAGYGKVYAVSEEATEKENQKNLERITVGMNVWYTKYAAEDVFAKDEEGTNIEHLKAVHITSVHAR